MSREFDGIEVWEDDGGFVPDFDPELFSIDVYADREREPDLTRGEWREGLDVETFEYH